MANASVKLTQIVSTPDMFARYHKDAVKDIKSLTNTAANKHRDVVRNWSRKNQPAFPIKTEIFPDSIVGTVTAKEKTKRRRVWLWLNRTGTKPHKIRARRKPNLRYLKGKYIAKTGLGGAFNGPGIVQGGVWRSPKEVNHPGFPPRNFSGRIAGEMNILEKEFFEERGRKAFKRAKRAAKRIKM